MLPVISTLIVPKGAVHVPDSDRAEAQPAGEITTSMVLVVLQSLESVLLKAQAVIVNYKVWAVAMLTSNYPVLGPNVISESNPVTIVAV